MGLWTWPMVLLYWHKKTFYPEIKLTPSCHSKPAYNKQRYYPSNENDAQNNTGPSSYGSCSTEERKLCGVGTNLRVSKFIFGWTITFFSISTNLKIIQFLFYHYLTVLRSRVNVILPSPSCSWINILSFNNIPINQSDFRVEFTVCVQQGLRASIPFLLGLRIGLGLNIWTGMLIQEHVLLSDQAHTCQHFCKTKYVVLCTFCEMSIEGC